MEQKKKQNTVFTQQEIEKHLQSALAAATPDVWSKLDLSVPQDSPADCAKRKHRRIFTFDRRFGGLCAAACVCLAVMGGCYHYEYVQVVSEVGIDVNPSLKLSLNRKDRITKAQGLNEDGQALLADTDLRGSTVEAAADQVVSSLVNQGYLSAGGPENAVLVSVSGKNQEKAEAVKNEFSSSVEKVLTEKQVNAVVYDQTIEVTDELKALAETYQVSPGKAEFVGQLVNENETLSSDTQNAYERMMGQTMEELTQEIQENEYYVSSKVTIIKAEPVSDSRERKLADRDDRQESGEDLSGQKADAVMENAAANPEETDDAKSRQPAEDAPAETPGADPAAVSEKPADGVQGKETEGGTASPEDQAVTEETPEERESILAKGPEEEIQAPENKQEEPVGTEKPETVPPADGVDETEKPDDSEEETSDFAEATPANAVSKESTEEESTEYPEGEDCQESEGSTEEDGDKALPADEIFPEDEKTEGITETAEISAEEGKIAESSEEETTNSQVPEQEEKSDSETAQQTDENDPQLPDEEEESNPEVSDPEEKNDSKLSGQTDENAAELPEQDDGNVPELPEQDGGNVPELPEQDDGNAPEPSEQDGENIPELSEDGKETVSGSHEQADEGVSRQMTEEEGTSGKKNVEIVPSWENEPDLFGPGDAIKYSQSGVQITQNGTQIIFEPAEEKEEKKNMYASDYLSGRERQLIRKGPGMYPDAWAPGVSEEMLLPEYQEHLGVRSVLSPGVIFGENYFVSVEYGQNGGVVYRIKTE